MSSANGAPPSSQTAAEVRPARADELDIVGELTLDAYQADGYLGPGSTGYAESLADAAGRMRAAELLVAVDRAGAVVGTVTIALPGSEYAEISREGELEFRMLAVAPAARGQGIGEQLTRAVLARAQELGLPRVVMCSSHKMAGAHRLYERLGFVRLPERDWSPGPGVQLIAFETEVVATT
ncbi:GNAT family N-acetyltransferase [Actinokineospora sp. HUAS TT18]|uniref:GNAT family N-acetyltransferase n=1 Tax=Actinokineospora sp. HUAS TT18 TaxID=3447451 RepID=UPI003F51D13D